MATRELFKDVLPYLAPPGVQSFSWEQEYAYNAAGGSYARLVLSITFLNDKFISMGYGDAVDYWEQDDDEKPSDEFFNKLNALYENIESFFDLIPEGEWPREKPANAT